VVLVCVTDHYRAKLQEAVFADRRVGRHTDNRARLVRRALDRPVSDTRSRAPPT